jgi:hypothetical protein
VSRRNHHGGGSCGQSFQDIAAIPLCTHRFVPPKVD